MKKIGQQSQVLSWSDIDHVMDKCTIKLRITDLHRTNCPQTTGERLASSVASSGLKLALA